MHAEIKTSRAKLGPKSLEPGDLVGALQNSELRSALRAAKRADRLRLAQTDDTFAEAALLAHPALSGLSAEPADAGQPSEVDMARSAYQQRNFAQQIAGLELREKTMEAVDVALKAAADAIRQEAGGLSEAEVERLREPKND